MLEQMRIHLLRNSQRKDGWTKRILVTSGILGSARRAGREYVGPRGRWCALIVWWTEDDDEDDDVEDVDDDVADIVDNHNDNINGGALWLSGGQGIDEKGNKTNNFDRLWHKLVRSRVMMIIVALRINKIDI